MDFLQKKSSWTYKAKELDYFPFKLKDFINAKVSKENYPDLKKDYPEEIPVEKINGNVLCLAPVNDEVWNTYDASLRIQKRLREHHFKHTFQIQMYYNIGHMMTIPFIPNNRYKNNMMTMNDNMDSWHKTISFFEKHL